MKLRAFSSLLAAVLIFPVLSCDKATPVAPEGTILTISANPSKVPLNGTSSITVFGRKPDGQPLNPGTEVRFTVDRGTIEPAVVEVRDGQATATFRADGRTGAVMVTAATGGTMTMVMTSIQVGETADTKPTLIVNANPDSIPIAGTSEITVTARNADGTPAAGGQAVTLTSTLGSLSPERPRTNNNGIATAKFTAGQQPGMVTIRAVLGTSDPQTVTLTIRDNIITLIASPTTVDRSLAVNQKIELTARVTNSSGNPVKNAQVTFQSPRGVFTGSGIITVPTDADGQAKATLTVRPADIDATTISSFDIVATTPSGGATPLTATQTITVTGQ